MLTKKQAELLAYIETYMAVEPVSPSFEEMKEAIGLKSKSNVHRLIKALVERGFLTRIPNRARALCPVRTAFNDYSDDELAKALRLRGWDVTPPRQVLSVAA